MITPVYTWLVELKFGRAAFSAPRPWRHPRVRQFRRR